MKVNMREEHELQRSKQVVTPAVDEGFLTLFMTNQNVFLTKKK